MLLNESIQAVIVLVCEEHAERAISRLNDCPEGNWFVLPEAAAGRLGYWPHVARPHNDSGHSYAILGFAERMALARTLQRFAAINENGSLCPDCVAYEWNITPVHLAASSRDPVCGNSVSCTTGFSHLYEGELFFFCSTHCRDAFHSRPQRYVPAKDAP